jgi:site-specific recombinase XerD
MRNTEKIDLFVRWMEAKNMAHSTVKIYRHCLLRFFNSIQKDSGRISQQEIQDYITRIPKHYSDSYRNQVVNSIRLYFIISEHKKLHPVNLPRPKREVFIPDILTVDEMERVIFSTKNLKHRAILFTLYDNGLRRSELLNMRLMDVRTHCSNPHLIIRNAKHHNARTIPLSLRCIELLKQYYRAYRPQTYLFESDSENTPYSATSVRNILENALKREGIKKHIRVHDLRHSFATHCLAGETNIKHLSKVLGHRNVKTTENYYEHLRPEELVIKRPQQQSDNIPVRHLKVV